MGRPPPTSFLTGFALEGQARPWQSHDWKASLACLICRLSWLHCWEDLHWRPDPPGISSPHCFPAKHIIHDHWAKLWQILEIGQTGTCPDTCSEKQVHNRIRGRQLSYRVQMRESLCLSRTNRCTYIQKTICSKFGDCDRSLMRQQSKARATGCNA